MTYLDAQDETQILLRDSAQDFLSQEHHLERLQAIYQGKTVLDRALWTGMAEQGWLALRLPEAMGGSSLEPVHAAIVAEQFGRHAVPEPLLACAVMPAVMASRFPGFLGWQLVTQGLIDGSHVATLAWQEDARSLDPVPATTMVERQTNGTYRLRGRKLGVACGSFADSLLVAALLEGEVTLWLVARGMDGVSLDESLASDGASVAVVSFEDVELTAEALLAKGPTVIEALSAAIEEAQLLAAWQLVGLASSALEITLEYQRTRVQFGHRIGSFQSMQHLSVDVRLQQALARAACQSALQRHAEAAGSAQAQAAIAAAKARASDAALLAGRFGVQAHGAIGFAAEAAIGCYLKAALRWAAFLGNGSHHRRQYALQAGLHGASL
ncbi:acyl-CoA dehydrogenase family protein [Ottowia thiooxydans]|uniref:acyl-CoA dehydrogenase family protein n=1 Tax=Ottowia thiooxydans TaxID=219182 RepID=UPI000425AB02|nr:acyl-CoA dehydrogenase family protein [Ottowia thiooxydans]